MSGAAESARREASAQGARRAATARPRDAAHPCGGPADAPRTLDEARVRIGALEARLADQARVRAELVHLVCHELRTPITVISGFGRLLQNEVQGVLNEEQHRYVTEVLKSCTRLDAFVSDLLEARDDAATPFRVDVERGRLHDTLEAQLESLLPMLEERDLRVELTRHAADDDMDFDPRRIAQVVTNLMTNAIRYGRAGGVIRVETRDLPHGAADDESAWVEVAVEDDGEGIPAADRERLFEPFVRGAGSEESSGLGIGLALCRRIVEAHGGRIRVDRGALGGARFVFELPRRRSAEGKDGQDGG